MTFNSLQVQLIDSKWFLYLRQSLNYVGRVQALWRGQVWKIFYLVYVLISRHLHSVWPKSYIPISILEKETDVVSVAIVKKKDFAISKE